MFNNISPPNKRNGITDVLTATSNEPMFNSRLVQKSELIISFIQDLALTKRISTHEICRMVLERLIENCNIILNSNFALTSCPVKLEATDEESK